MFISADISRLVFRRSILITYCCTLNARIQSARVETLCIALRFSVASSLYLHARPKILLNVLITSSCGDDFCLIALCDSDLCL